MMSATDWLSAAAWSSEKRRNLSRQRRLLVVRLRQGC